MYYKNQSISFDEPTLKQEQALFRRYHKGDLKARDAIVQNHILLARTLALRTAGSNWDADLVISEANVALLDAIEHFDYTHGWRFGSFLRKYIHGAVLRLMSNYIKDRKRCELLGDLRATDSAPEILVEDDHETEDFHAHVREILNKVVTDPKDRKIIQMRYWEGLSFKEISEHLGNIGVEGVRQRHLRLLDKIKKSASKISKDFVFHA